LSVRSSGSLYLTCNPSSWILRNSDWLRWKKQHDMGTVGKTSLHAFMMLTSTSQIILAGTHSRMLNSYSGRRCCWRRWCCWRHVCGIFLLVLLCRSYRSYYRQRRIIPSTSDNFYLLLRKCISLHTVMQTCCTKTQKKKEHEMMNVTKFRLSFPKKKHGFYFSFKMMFGYIIFGNLIFREIDYSGKKVSGKWFFGEMIFGI